MEIEKTINGLKGIYSFLANLARPQQNLPFIDEAITILNRVKRLEKALEWEVEVGNPLRAIHVLRWLRDGEEE